MSQRTTTGAVQTLLGANYGKLPDGTDPSLQPYVDSASNLIDNCVTKASAAGLSYSTATLELMERWMACAFYCQMDPLYASRSTAGASGSFIQEDETNRYKKGAMDLDPLGFLVMLLKRQRAGAFWMGKPKSSQIDYCNRN